MNAFTDTEGGPVVTSNRHDVDVVIIGGGIGGGAIAAALARAGLAVEIVEIQNEYRDLNRGEWLSPWGVGEAEQLGVADAIFAANPTPLTTWIQWDEINDLDSVPTIDLTEHSWRGRPGLSIHHHTTSQCFTDAAVEAGAVLRMGVRDLAIDLNGRWPVVSFRHEAQRVARRCRLVIGAGGKNAPTAKLVGIRQERTTHHWGGALAVEGLHGWPEGVQAVGTEDRTMFFVFPQRGGRARLYLNYPTEDRRLYTGRDAGSRFLQAFDLRCIPADLRDIVLNATPVSVMHHPAWRTWMSAYDRPGVVLIGDEAGLADTVLGTGLACALRDARVLTELLVGNDDWGTDSLEPYRMERTERMRRMHIAANLLATLYAEFGLDARERRRRAWERMREDPRYMVTVQMAAAGPDLVPRMGTSQAVIDRLLAPEPARRSPRVTAGTS